jgi:hypothetical protein
MRKRWRNRWKKRNLKGVVVEGLEAGEGHVVVQEVKEEEDKGVVTKGVEEVEGMEEVEKEVKGVDEVDGVEEVEGVEEET